MQIVDVSSSIFCARIRAIVHAKGLPYELLPPPGGLGSEAHRRLDPIARVPALRLESGAWLHESLAIALLLEQRHREPPLLPADESRRARRLERALYIDNYVVPSLFGLSRLDGVAGAEGELDRHRVRAEQAFSWLDVDQGEARNGQDLQLDQIWLGLAVALADDITSKEAEPLVVPARVREEAAQALAQPSLRLVISQLLAVRSAA